jgi:transcription elongation factor Elf1
LKKIRIDSDPYFCTSAIEQLDYKYTCPYCGEEISSLLDLSIEKREYIEDCEVAVTRLT